MASTSRLIPASSRIACLGTKVVFSSLRVEACCYLTLSSHRLIKDVFIVSYHHLFETTFCPRTPLVVVLWTCKLLLFLTHALT